MLFCLCVSQEVVVKSCSCKRCCEEVRPTAGSLSRVYTGEDEPLWVARSALDTCAYDTDGFIDAVLR